MKYAVNCKLGAKFNVTGDLQTKTADTGMIFFVSFKLIAAWIYFKEATSLNLIESKRMFILPE